MSLHYLVKLEMLIVHVITLSCYRKKLLNLFYLTYSPQLITAFWSIAREGV